METSPASTTKTSDCVYLEENLDVITKTAVFWIKLANGKKAEAASVSVIVFPFSETPPQVSVKFHFPRIDYPAEANAYANACFQAGAWAAEYKTPVK